MTPETALYLSVAFTVFNSLGMIYYFCKDIQRLIDRLCRLCKVCTKLGERIADLESSTVKGRVTEFLKDDYNESERP